MNPQPNPDSFRSRVRRTLTPIVLLLALAVPSSAGAQLITITNLWNISTADGRSYVTANPSATYTERGVAYNPLNNHAYIVSRQGSLKVAILDGDTGAELGFLNVAGISGGTFALSTISVADDGAIYAANLTTGSSGSPFRIYRWADETSTPVAVYALNPSNGANNNRYGESFDARGSGTNTELIASANGAPIVAIFRPTDESMASFTSTRIDVSGIGAADLTKGIGFGPTNTFFGKNSGVTSLRHCIYDLTLGTASLLASYTLVSGVAPIDADPVHNLIAGVESANALTPHNLRVYDLSSGSAVQIYQTNFPAPAANNGNIVGQAQISGDRIFAIDTQNGVVMCKILVDTNIASPNITSQPDNQTVVQGGYTTLSVAATGTRPLFYQWSFNGTPIDGAITNTLVLTNISIAADGEYTVAVRNAAGTNISNAAILTVTPTPLNANLRVLWKLPPNSRPYLTADNTQRGLAYNPVSGNVLLVSRAPTNGIHVLDGETGAHKYSMNLGDGLITGGSAGITLNMIACTEDGQVFAANLTTDGTSATKLRVYGWLDDGELEPPYLAWEGDPGSGTAQRWGDSFDARGVGLDSEIIVGSRNSALVSIIRPGFGANSSANVINVTDAEPGNFGLSIRWGNGFTFYGKSAGTSLRHVAYDPAVLNASSISTNNNYPAMNVVGFDPDSHLLAGIFREIPDNLRLLKGPELVEGDITLDTEFFLVDNDNPNGTGDIAMRKGRLYALQTNSGLIGAAVSPVLHATKLENSLILSWIGTAVLQGTPSLDQPFEDIAGATSGYTIDLTTTSGNRFFRLKE
jgi:hypothetical protein